MRKRAATRLRARRAFLAIAVATMSAIIFLNPRVSGAAGVDLDDLLRRIAAKSADEVGFHEERFLGVVTEPLKSTGTLLFRPPDTLIKKTETPFRETAIVDRDRLTVLDAEGAEIHSISLWASEEMRIVFDGLRAVLRGDAPALRQLFEISLSESDKGWQIDLTPRVSQGESQILQVLVRGRAGRIASFEIREANGDRAVIRLTGSVERS
jgi:outer membrane lipoprotein-sorting protein